MKKVLFVCSVLLLISCQEVVKVDLDTAAPRLVVDASIDWEKGTTGNHQVVKLSTTTGFYSNVIPNVSSAIVFVTNSSNTIFNFIEEVPNSGEYICNNFVPIIGENYVLTVNYAGQTYVASEKMMPVPNITSIAQRNDAGFNGSDIEVKFYFQDNGLENNYYMSRFVTTKKNIPEFEVFDDRFQQGNQIFGLYSSSDIKPNDSIDYALFGISLKYYNYMNILLSIAGTNGGSPFQTPPATVRGNLVNQNNEDNYCLGYFRLCEVDKMHYIVQ